MRPLILCSKWVRLGNMGGSVMCPDKVGAVQLGFGHVGIVDVRTQPTVWEVRGSVKFDGFARFGPGSRVVVGDGAHLCFGDNFLITAASSIIASRAVSFGDNVLVSWDCLFMDSDMHPISVKSGKRINEDRPIVVGNHVWVGCNTTILKGSFVPDGCVIAAGSVLSGRLERESAIYSSKTVLKEDIVWNH